MAVEGGVRVVCVIVCEVRVGGSLGGRGERRTPEGGFLLMDLEVYLQLEMEIGFRQRHDVLPPLHPKGLASI